MKRKAKIAKKIALIVVGVAAIGAVALLFVVLRFSRDLPTVEQIANIRVNQSTKIYDRSGAVLLYEISNGEERTVVPLENIPKHLINATLAMEDENFYTEPAFDWRGIVRALLANLRHGQIVQGGSTITQQLAKNAFLTSEQTAARKIKEIILATKINQHYTKDQILALYLNQIPYGATTYGVEAASVAYFGKSVSELNLAQSALLASIPKAPSYYSPRGSHVRELIERQKLVLGRMLTLGKIAKKEYDDALKFNLSLSPQKRGIKAPHFVMAVQEYLVQKYGEEAVRKGGLRVTTTINWDLQQAAEKAVREVGERNEKTYGVKNAALVAEDAKTGQILALVGSRDYFDTKNEGNFDVASHGLRQPGSSLKPFVYLAAFERGDTPDTILVDLPTEVAAQNPACPPVPNFGNDDKNCFHPQNADAQFHGPLAIRDALAQSRNIPAVKMLYLVGVRNAVKRAYDFGLTTLSSPDLYGLSFVLGGGAVKLMDLVGAYSALAQDGIKHSQHTLLEVKDANGRVLESYKDESVRVAEPQPVRLINSILSDVEARRPLYRAGTDSTAFPGHDVALKTGTSNDFRDVWAVGYTPSFVVGVWAGNNDNSPMRSRGLSIFTSVPLWRAFMAEAVKTLPFETFEKPEPVISLKPILGGEYLRDKQIHSILYYVNRQDPQGPAPERPESDPQFLNWETGVLVWAKRNLPDFAAYNQTIGRTQNNVPAPSKVDLQFPSAGEMVTTGVNIRALITGTVPVIRVRTYWNGELVADEGVNQEMNFVFGRSYAQPPDTRPQNLLEIEAVDQNGASGRAGVIVYGNQ